MFPMLDFNEARLPEPVATDIASLMVPQIIKSCWFAERNSMKDVRCPVTSNTSLFYS